MDPQVFWQNQDVPASDPAAATEGEPTDPNVPVAASEPGNVPDPATVESERLAALERERDELQQRSNHLQNTLNQAAQWAQSVQEQTARQAENQRYEQWWESALEQANAMGRDDGARYLTAERRKIEAERERAFQAREQQLNQLRERERMVLGKPIFINEIATRNKLDAEDKALLEALSNPDDAARIAPLLARNRSQYKELEQRINQVALTGQAANMQAAGMGRLGGTNAPQGAPAPPSDPDELAIWNLHHNTTNM